MLRITLLGCCLVFGSIYAADRPVARALSPEATPSILPQANLTSRPLITNGIAIDPPNARGALVYPINAPETVSSSAMMIDARSGSVLFFKNPDVKRPVASTQKLLTALVVYSSGSLDSRVRVSAGDCQVEPTKLGFRPGDAYTRRQLLAALLVHSCNDAAVCLARNDSGNLAEFSYKMNAKALSLGAGSSHFVNPNGLPVPGQYSTARDMARIAFAAYRVGVLREFMRQPGLTFTYNSGRQRYFEATNKLVTRSPMFTGMKTGYTVASGRCLVSSASGGGREIILVQLGGTLHPVFDDAQRLLLWGLSRSENLPAVAQGDRSPSHL